MKTGIIKSVKSDVFCNIEIQSDNAERYLEYLKIIYRTGVEMLTVKQHGMH